MIPAPLYIDPIYNGAADPMIIRKESDGVYYMFYTQRRANQNVEYVSYCYGTAIGVAESLDGEDWHYRGALDLGFEFGCPTFWAPEIVYEPTTKIYHMFVTYICGVYTRFKGVATLEHYTSEDLFHWTHIGSLSFGSDRIIDPCIYQLPSGVWRMWYKDERHKSNTCYADSADLYEWEYRGVATSDCSQEGPNVFRFADTYWLIADIWRGFAVYRSEDCENFVRQDGNLLYEGGTRKDDGVQGRHADVLVLGDRAFIVYFTHPDANYTERSSVQMAELKVKNGILTCDRNSEFSIHEDANLKSR